jgi:hypothetical protein
MIWNMDVIQENIKFVNDGLSNLINTGFGHTLLLATGGCKLSPEASRSDYNCTDSPSSVRILGTNSQRAPISLSPRLDDLF